MIGYQNYLVSKLKRKEQLLKREALICNDIPGEDFKLNIWYTLPYIEAISKKLGHICVQLNVPVQILMSLSLIIKILNRWFQMSKIQFQLEIGLEYTD